MGGITNPSDWDFTAYFGRSRNGPAKLDYIAARAEIPHPYVSSPGQDIASLESFRGHFVAVIVSGAPVDLSAVGLRVRTVGQLQLSIGPERLRTRPLSSGLVSEFRFPSDIDPRSFDDFIENG